MPDFGKIMNNIESPEITANFFVLCKDEDYWIEGWIAMEESFEEFIILVQGELEYSWGEQFSNMVDYIIFYIDLEDKNNLKEIKDEESYQKVIKLDDIFIVVLHREIKYRIIENLPPVFEWFTEINNPPF